MHQNNSDIDDDGLSSCDGDCDDDDAEIGFEDLDGDGFSSCLDDCFDSDADADMDGVPDSAAVYPGAASLRANSLYGGCRWRRLWGCIGQ